jgi:hypothetical protein
VHACDDSVEVLPGLDISSGQASVTSGRASIRSANSSRALQKLHVINLRCRTRPLLAYSYGLSMPPLAKSVNPKALNQYGLSTIS